MERTGFILPEAVLNEKVPSHFIEPQGTFKEYLREYYVKDGKVLFDCNRKSDTGTQYTPSEVEVNIWLDYFDKENAVEYYEHYNEFNPQKDETII